MENWDIKNFCLCICPIKHVCVFTNIEIKKDDVIGLYITEEKNQWGRPLKNNLNEHYLGRYCNHSNLPNSYIIQKENEYFLCANSNINIGEEITVDYKEAEIKMNEPYESYYRKYFVETKLSKFGKAND